MSRLTDAIGNLERDLNRHRGDDPDSLLNRRYAIRVMMGNYGREQYDMGHADGIRDVHDSQREADRRAEEAAEREGNDNA